MRKPILNYIFIVILTLATVAAQGQGRKPSKPGKGGGSKTTKQQKKTIIDRVFGDAGKRAKRAEMKAKNKQITQFTVKTDFSKSRRYVMFGGAVGAANYFGDLAPRFRRGSSDLDLTRSSFSGFVTYRVHPYITLSGSLGWYRIRGDDGSADPAESADAWGRYTRGLSFRNDIKEFALTGIFDLFPTDKGYLRRNFLNPYAFIGIAAFHHNPKARKPVVEPGKQEAFVDLQPLGTEGQFSGIPGSPRAYSRIQLAVPFGIGVRYRIHDKLDVGLNIGYRFLFTDYIDDVSSQYPRNEAYDAMYAKNPLSVLMSNRSGEEFAAATGERRRLRTLDGRQSLEKEVFYSNEADAFTATRIVGNEFGGAPRGNKRRDYVINTCATLTYMYDIKQKPPRFR